MGRRRSCAAVNLRWRPHSKHRNEREGQHRRLRCSPTPEKKSDPQHADEGKKTPARNVDRDEENVQQLVHRLNNSGISDEQIEMEFEMKYQHYAQQAVARLKAERPGKGRQALQEKSENKQRQHEHWERSQTRHSGPRHNEAAATTCPVEDLDEDPERPLCKSGCGRFAAEGYDACCRTCTYSRAATHGPKCRLF